MSKSRYAQWQAEKRGAEHLIDISETPADGFWRMAGARTKPDYPVAIWAEDGQLCWLIGHRSYACGLEQAVANNEWQEFVGMSWPHCSAVERDEYDNALASGFWASDGKPARREEGDKIGPGGNDAPEDEIIADEIDALLATATKTKAPTSQSEADAAEALAGRLRKLWRRADDARKREKQPHDDAAQRVQDKWLPRLNPLEEAGKALTTMRNAWLKAEQRRRDDEARAETERRRQEALRIAREEAERETERRRILAEAQRQEAEAARKAAEAAGDVELLPPPAEPELPPAPVIVDEAAILASVEAVTAEKPLAGAAFGRRAGLKKVTVGEIVDVQKLVAHLLGDAAAGRNPDRELMEFLDKRMRSAIKAKIEFPGCEYREDWA